MRLWPLFLCLLLMLAVPSAGAAEFYVDTRAPKSGNGHAPQSAMKTIGEAAAVMQGGDTCYIRAGIYRETVLPARGGSPGQPLVFTSYNGEPVTVSGADEATGGWTVYRDQVYKKAIALPVKGYADAITNNTTLLANQVFVGGRMMVEARWPNLASSDDLLNRSDFRKVMTNAWMTTNGTTLQDPAIPDIAGGWTGGVIWFIGWFIPRTSVISASSPGQVQFPVKAEKDFHDFYFLSGRLGALDAEKEWFYDGTTLYLWAPGGSVPANVEVKMRNLAFDLRGKSHIVISNLNIFAATIWTDPASESLVLDRLRVQYNSHFVTLSGKDVLYSHSQESGVRLMGPNSIIRNSVVEYSAGHGIVLGADGCVAENNLVHDVSYGGTYCCGIFPTPGNARNTIAHNTIYRTGRSGIDMVYANKDIGYNDIYDFGMLNTDLGAIYSARSTDLTGTRIHHNWLHDAKNDDTHKFPVGAGIYFDQNAKPTRVDHNVFWNNHKNDIRVEQGAKPFHEFYHNTLASTASNFWKGFETYPASYPTNSKNNIYRSAIRPNIPGAGDMTAGTDPLFLEEGAGGLRFRLKIGSPALNHGVPIPGWPEGVPDGKPDAGAYESGVDWKAGVTNPGPLHVQNSGSSASMEDLEAGFVPLFNGTNLSGWHVKCQPADTNKTFWTVDNGAILCDSMGRGNHNYVWLLTDKEYGDFELRLEFQAYKSSPGNSGLQFRSRFDDTAQGGWLDGPQVDIHPPQDMSWRTGFIYDETREEKRWVHPSQKDWNMDPKFKPKEHIFKYGEDGNAWNQLTLICATNHVKTVLNGLVVTDWDSTGVLDNAAHVRHRVGRAGHFALQLHSGDQLKMRFRNIRVRPL